MGSCLAIYECKHIITTDGRGRGIVQIVNETVGWLSNYVEYLCFTERKKMEQSEIHVICAHVIMSRYSRCFIYKLYV